MEYSLQAYFDIGVSLGLGDDVFVRSASHVNVPDILKIGIRNPLGLGIQYRVDENNPEVIAEWRRYARSKLDDPEMELGYDDSLRGGPTEEGEEKWFQAFFDRAQILTVIILILVVTLFSLGKILRRRTKK
jgi:hypothetical protein